MPGPRLHLSQEQVGDRAGIARQVAPPRRVRVPPLAPALTLAFALALRPALPLPLLLLLLLPPLVVGCKSGKRSEMACKLMAGAGEYAAWLWLPLLV